MNKQERIQELEMAADRIEEAMVHIAQAVEGTSDQRGAESYIIAHLRNWARGENPYDASAIPRLIENLEEEEEEEEEECEEPDDIDEDGHMVEIY
ncbi:hypothetical protein CMI47_04010 [Candidatus Pacearchaeota archaeon]|nr:hypothetical protein [Candidatus Pacearchaeota archaeon]